MAVSYTHLDVYKRQGYRIAINILIHDKIKEEKDNMNAFPLFNYSYLTKQEISSLFFNLSRYNRTHFHININASCNPASSLSLIHI